MEAPILPLDYKLLACNKRLLCTHFKNRIFLQKCWLCVKNSLDPDETPSNSASQPDLTRLHIILWSGSADSTHILCRLFANSASQIADHSA